MAQTTQITIDNQTFPSFRQKLNESLSALNTLNSGTSRPSSAVAGTIWLDTTNATNPTLKFFDGTDDISLATIDYTANTVNWLDSSVTLTSPVEISGNSTAGAEIRLPEDTDNGSNYVGLKASDSIASNITFTLPSADGTDGQALKTDGSGNLSFGDAGRLGTVNWDTTAKTTNFTAVNGNGYFINTTSGVITMTLPASPSAGDIVAFKDYANTFDTNNLTIARNGSNIGGDAIDATISVEGQSGTLVYVDSTKGWLIVSASTESDLPKATFLTATGGSITCCGDFKIHTFNSPGTFCVSSISSTPADNEISYMVIAGGAGGGGFGGGGAGGFRENKSAVDTYTASPLNGATPITVTAQGYPITVGAGGSGATQGNSGSNSIFSTVTSAGGGGGGGFTPAPGSSGVPGGSGGGGGTPNSPPYPGQPGGTGNTPPVSPPQGNPGGTGTTGATSGGGAGGASASGNPSSGTTGGSGGNGVATSISGSSVTRAGGGGGAGGSTPGSGGSGGGGDGGVSPSPTSATAGTANTGGGGGGNYTGSGASGGSGVVIIRYKYQ